MTTFSNLPGTLNIEVARGDTLSIDIDFDRSLVGYTLDARLVSLVSSAAMQSLSAQLTAASTGIVTVSMTSEETAALPIGTLGWELSWESPQEVARKVISGFVEVK